MYGLTVKPSSIAFAKSYCVFSCFFYEIDLFIRRLGFVFFLSARLNIKVKALSSVAVPFMFRQEYNTN